MMIKSIKLPNGSSLINTTAEQALEAGAEPAVVAAAVEEATALQSKLATRARIEKTAGDIPSLLGTTADAAAVSLISTLQIFILVAEAGTPEMKAALGTLPFPMPVAKAKAFLADIKSGKIKVPALIKGTDKVYAEVAVRSTATAIAMADVPKA